MAIEIDILKTMIERLRKNLSLSHILREFILDPIIPLRQDQRETLNTKNHHDNHPLKRSTISAWTSSRAKKAIIARSRLTRFMNYDMIQLPVG